MRYFENSVVPYLFSYNRTLEIIQMQVVFHRILCEEFDLVITPTNTKKYASPLIDPIEPLNHDELYDLATKYMELGYAPALCIYDKAAYGVACNIENHYLEVAMFENPECFL